MDPRTSPTELGTILSVWAHPDDETYLAGGTMAAARANGQRVVCVSATAGELGTGDPETWPPARLGPVRRWEAAAAMAVLGVDEHRFLDFADGTLAGGDEDGIDRIAELITDVQPDTILTFGADGMTFHTDHIAMHHWVTAAWRRCGGPARLLYATTTDTRAQRFGPLFEEWHVYMTEERPAGVPATALAVDVQLDGLALDRKLTALRAMATQTSDLLAGMDAGLYASLIAEELFVEATRPEDDR